MKAYVKSSAEATEISLLDVPVPALTETELMIKVCAIGVGVHDEYFQPPKVEYPYVVGIEAAGTIEAIGEEVVDYAVGERIAFINALNKKGGTWAEYTSLPSTALIIKIPEGMSFAEAAAIPVVGNTILKAFSTLDLKPDQSVFIAGGSGAIGTLAIQLAAQYGYTVIASASKQNHDYMKSLGAEVTVDYHDEDWQDQIKKLLPAGVDAAIAIQPGTAEESATVVKANGTVATISGDQVALDRGIILKQIPHLADVTKELLNLYIKIADGTIKQTLQIYPFTEGKETLEKVKTRHTRGKLVLTLSN